MPRSLARASLLLLSVQQSLTAAHSVAISAAAAAAADMALAGSAANSPPDASGRVHPNEADASGSAAATSRAFERPKDQALWLDRHNWLRSDGLLWPAADMAELEWDAALADEARAAIASCDRQPQDAPALHVFADSAPGRALDASLVEDAIAAWGLNELFSLASQLEPPAAPGAPVGVGHYSRYSQLVWAATSRVGCAYALCPRGRLAACKYSPGGNAPGAPWYTSGAPCSRCATAGLSNCASRLCSSNATRTVALAGAELAAAAYLPHKVRSLQLALDAAVARQQQQPAVAARGAGTAVLALSASANNTISTLCNGTAGATITQEQLSMLSLDGGLSPLAVIFGLFLGVSVILVMIVCIMHATKPKKKGAPDEEHGAPSTVDKDGEDEGVQVI